MQSNPVKFIFGPDTEWAFVHVDKPMEGTKYGAGKYSITLLIDKGNEDIGRVSKVLKEIYEANKAMFVVDGKQKALRELNLPLDDGDEKRPDSPSFANKYFVNATSKYKPEIVDEALEPVDPETVRGGDCGRVSVQFVAYATDDGNMGISCRLNNLQRIKLSEYADVSYSSAKNDFAEFAKAGSTTSSETEYEVDNDLPF